MNAHGTAAVLTGLLLAATSPMIAFSQNFAHAAIAMGLMGVPIAAVVAVGYAFFLDLIPQGRAAEFVGFYAFCIGLAQFVALLGGGKLIDIIGFRLVFLLAGIPILLGFIIFQFIRPPKNSFSRLHMITDGRFLSRSIIAFRWPA